MPLSLALSITSIVANVAAIIGGGGSSIPVNAYSTPDGLDYYRTPDDLDYYETP